MATAGSEKPIALDAIILAYVGTDWVAPVSSGAKRFDFLELEHG